MALARVGAPRKTTGGPCRQNKDKAIGMSDDAPRTPRSKVTVLVPACNEQKNIEACLESAAWADELFVVDSFSADATPELARAKGARVIQHEYVNSATQKNWAIPQAVHPWVLVLDADERVTPVLRDEILDVLRRDAAGQGGVHDGYRVRRLNHFLGRRVRYCGWQNDRCLRLFRRDKGRYQDREVHADVEVEGGDVGILRGRLLHYTFDGFEQYMRKFDRYTTLAAGDRDRVTGTVRWHHLALRPLGRFLKQYVLKLGFLDGSVGLIVCSLAAFSVFMKYAKLYERRLKDAERGPDQGAPGADAAASNAKPSANSSSKPLANPKAS
jgi:glycosyltransferase involved in cell wall biosynthesis